MTSVNLTESGFYLHKQMSPLATRFSSTADFVTQFEKLEKDCQFSRDLLCTFCSFLIASLSRRFWELLFCWEFVQHFYFSEVSRVLTKFQWQQKFIQLSSNSNICKFQWQLSSNGNISPDGNIKSNGN